MQKYAFFTGSCQSLPAIQYLQQSAQLACVVLVDTQPNHDLMQLQHWLQQSGIKTLAFERSDEKGLISQLDRLAVNRGLIYLFRHKIRPALIQYFSGHLVNIHPSPLPDYKGPFPLYWQLRNGENTTALTLHQVTESVDCGNIAADVEIEIHPFDTMNCVQYKVAQALPRLVEKYCQLDEKQEIKWRKKEGSGSKSAPQVEQQQLIVNWQKQTGKQVVNMARAGNVDSGCALFQFRSEAFQLLQASVVDNALTGVQAGMVIEVDRQNGLVIKTVDGALRLDVIGTQQGVFDGYRFAVLFGLEAGLSLVQKDF
ncbi:formyltransferase family protein [Pseudoalteromonas ostreae]|uniref:formyltransferase family protein n=1 Tax=Pseudoalteromonas ostreae TaxID=2774154 RepID=UPI001B399B9E|nr:formyltransferase family protein [Pseudoalteromonas ostreae]